jgi:lysozyme
LRADLTESAAAIQNRFGTNLTKNQFDTLVSFHFNLGGGWMKSSGLAKAIDQGNFTEAAAIMKKYVNADGKRLEGLVKRRKVEAELLLG